MQETWVWSLSQEDPLEKKVATHSSIRAWKIPWMEEPGRLQSIGSQRARHDWVTFLSLWFSWCEYVKQCKSIPLPHIVQPLCFSCHLIPWTVCHVSTQIYLVYCKHCRWIYPGWFSHCWQYILLHVFPSDAVVKSPDYVSSGRMGK